MPLSLRLFFWIQNWLMVWLQPRLQARLAPWLARHPQYAMRWNQIIEMAVAALVLWVLVQNDNAAKDFGTQVITTMQNTLTQMLTVSY